MMVGVEHRGYQDGIECSEAPGYSGMLNQFLECSKEENRHPCRLGKAQQKQRRVNQKALYQMVNRVKAQGRETVELLLRMVRCVNGIVLKRPLSIGIFSEYESPFCEFIVQFC